MHSPRTPGREALNQTFDGFSVLVPDLRITVEDIIAGGDWAAVRSTLTGTSAGPYLGVDPAGRPIRLEAIDLWRMEDGLVTEGWHVEDFAAALVDRGRGHLHVTATRRGAAAGRRNHGGPAPALRRSTEHLLGLAVHGDAARLLKHALGGSGATLHGRPCQQGQSSHSRNR
jgi:hypothetical protein